MRVNSVLPHSISLPQLSMLVLCTPSPWLVIRESIVEETRGAFHRVIDTLKDGQAVAVVNNVSQSSVFTAIEV